MKQILFKRIRWLFLAAAFLLMAIETYAATETATRFYDSSLLAMTPVTENGVSYTRLNWLGLDSSSIPGSPEMPVEYIRFIVPVYTNNFRVRIKASGLNNRHIDARVYPTQEPVRTDNTDRGLFTMPDKKYYSEILPIRAEYVESGFVDGCNHIVTVAVFPAEYNDVNKVITTASSIEVYLEYDNCTEAELGSTPLFPPVACKYLDLSSMVVNPAKTTNRLYVPVEKGADNLQELYYIITPKKLESAFQNLAIWKRQKGYNVIVKCIEDICGDPRYQIGAMYSVKDENPEEVLDSAMSLRCFLKDQFLLNGHFFCLLGGDWRTSMPIRKSTSCDFYKDQNGNTVYSTDNGDKSIPTDIYFSNLSDKFPLIKRSHMSIYSFVLNDSTFRPDIAIGRLLCATPGEVENNFHKLKIYEANPGYGDNDYLSRGVFFEGCGRYWDNDRWYHGTCIINNSKEIRSETDFLDSITLFQDHYHASQFKYTNMDPSAYQSRDSLDGPTALEVMRAIETAGFSSWHAHGSPYGIACGINGQIIYSDDSRIGLAPYNYPNYKNYPHSGLNNVHNLDHPGFVYSISCDNAPFDALTWDEGDANENRMDTINLGRAWTVNSKNGGPAAVMNTRSGYVQESDTLELKWVQQLKIIHKVGESFRQAIIKSHIFESAFAAANLLGDPEFEMWFGKPRTFDIVFNPTETGIQLSGDVPESVSLVASNGIPSKTIRKYAQSGDIINSFNEGEFCISLWKSNYLPIITLFGQNGSLEIPKKYIARNAILGDDSSSVSSSRVYAVKNGGKLEIETMDDISTYAGFVIEKGGEVILRCDRDVNLNGVIVKNGGKLTVYARNVEMGKNFKVDNGGIFQIF